MTENPDKLVTMEGQALVPLAAARHQRCPEIEYLIRAAERQRMLRRIHQEALRARLPLVKYRS
jgi:hypothetical protein